jgi:virginiamycin B lyase
LAAEFDIFGLRFAFPVIHSLIRVEYWWQSEDNMRSNRLSLKNPGQETHMRQFTFLFIISIFTSFVSGPAAARETADNNDGGDTSGGVPVAAMQINITEWPVPWKETGPRDPDVAPDGSIWMVGQRGDYVARFQPASETFSRWELPPGTGPHNLIVDRDGFLWISGNKKAYIGRMNPGTGEMERFDMPADDATDPHTLVFGGESEIWFTMQWGNYVGRLNRTSGKVDLVAVPTGKSRPYGINMDSKGRPWIALLGTNGLAVVDPASMKLSIVELPRKAARLRRLVVTSDDAVWYTDYSEGYIGKYEPELDKFTEWKTPSVRSGPYAMATDGKGRIWFVETWPDPNLMVGFDPASGEFFSVTPIPSGAGSVRHMVWDRKTNSLWFGTDTNNLAQAILP